MKGTGQKSSVRCLWIRIAWVVPPRTGFGGGILNPPFPNKEASRSPERERACIYDKKKKKRHWMSCSHPLALGVGQERDFVPQHLSLPLSDLEHGALERASDRAGEQGRQKGWPFNSLNCGKKNRRLHIFLFAFTFASCPRFFLGGWGFLAQSFQTMDTDSLTGLNGVIYIEYWE